MSHMSRIFYFKCLTWSLGRLNMLRFDPISIKSGYLVTDVTGILLLLKTILKKINVDHVFACISKAILATFDSFPLIMSLISTPVQLMITYFGILSSTRYWYRSSYTFIFWLKPINIIYNERHSLLNTITNVCHRNVRILFRLYSVPSTDSVQRRAARFIMKKLQQIQQYLWNAGRTGAWTPFHSPYNWQTCYARSVVTLITSIETNIFRFTNKRSYQYSFKQNTVRDWSNLSEHLFRYNRQHPV